MAAYITFIAIGIIIIVFIYFLYQTSKLKRIRKIITNILSSEDIIKSLQESKLSTIVETYQKGLIFDSKGEKKTNIPASELFTETSAGKILSLNYRMIETASGTLVGLGLLGTFLGLTFGVIGFDSSNTENIQSSIQLLLNGMGMAFSTSLAGMGLSMIYTALEKRWKNKFCKALFDLTERLDNTYYIDDSLLMQNCQLNLFNDLQDKLAEYMEAQTKSITSVLEKQLTYTNDEGNRVVIANAIREILKENEQQSKALKSFSTDLALQLNDGFDEVLSRQMQQKLIPLMESVDNTTKAVVEHIDQMAVQVSSPATDMIQNVVNELKSSMVAIMAEFKNNLSGSATNQLEELASTLGVAAKSMADFPKNMENISSTLQVTIEEVKNAISEISNTSASSNSKAMQQMQEQIMFATTSIGNAITEVKDVMSSITRSSEQSSNDVINKLAVASQQMSNFMNDAMAQMTTSMQESIKEVLSGVNASLMDVTKAVSSITQSSEHSSQGVMNQLISASTQLSNLMNNTMSNVTSSVKNSMKSITDDVARKQSDLLALQESMMEETRKLLVLFTNGISRLEQVNTAVGGTMNMFQLAQGQITGSTAHLQTITGDLKNATELFNKGQSDYTSSLMNLQQMNQNNIDSITSLLMDTGDMSSEYVKKFETIRLGLASIFTQLQSGLNEYSKTVQSTTQKYLDQYSTSLTNTTDALSSTIQQQNEVVEMLVESLNAHKKSL